MIKLIEDKIDRYFLLIVMTLGASLMLYLTFAIIFAGHGINLNNTAEGCIMFFVLLPALFGSLFYWKLEL